MSFSFVLPPIDDSGNNPIWVQNGFRIGDHFEKILKYSINKQGWNDELTFFHEETAGDNHFIDKASRNYTIKQLKKNINNDRPTILEIGCSSGFMLKKMKEHFPKANIIGADVVDEPLYQLNTLIPTVPLIQFDLVHCPLPDNCIDAIVMLNVLEHIEHDYAALEQIYRILKPGGIVIIEVPAGPQLFDVLDKLLLHYRRYRLRDLKNLISPLGFQVIKQSHLGFFIYPPFAVVKRKNKKLLRASPEEQRLHAEKAIKNTGSNRLLHLMMKLELCLGNIINYPIGIRSLITAKK